MLTSQPSSRQQYKTRYSVLVKCSNLYWWARAELARAIARAEGFSARLGLAFDLFHFSSKSKIGRKRAEIWFSVEDLFFLLIFIINLYWKWLNYAAKSNYSTLKTPFVLINSDKWSWNWLESCYWSKIGNLIVVKKICKFLAYTRAQNVCPGWPVYEV